MQSFWKSHFLTLCLVALDILAFSFIWRQSWELREALTAQQLPDAQTVATMRDGRRVRYAGLVICRQRPGTASGVTFMTLEDETGFVNLVIWKQVFDDYAVLARTASFLGVTGTLQAESGVVHLIVDALWTPEIATPPATAGSRDFH